MDKARKIDPEKYARAGVFRHFTQDCRCSMSLTAQVDVTGLLDFSHRTGTRFSLNFLYVLSRALNSREDYRMSWREKGGELWCYDVIHPTQYIFHEDTETCTPVYSRYNENYAIFYREAAADADRAKQSREYLLDAANHPNWFDASCIPWLSYEGLHIELPDGALYFMPIVNWGKYHREGDRVLMPVSVRLNHAVADGYLVAKVFELLDAEMDRLCHLPADALKEAEPDEPELELELELEQETDPDIQAILKLDLSEPKTAGSLSEQCIYEQVGQVVRDVMDNVELYATRKSISEHSLYLKNLCHGLEDSHPEAARCIKMLRGHLQEHCKKGRRRDVTAEMVRKDMEILRKKLHKGEK